MYVAYVYAHVHEKRCKSTKINRYEQNFKEKSVEKKNFVAKVTYFLQKFAYKGSYSLLHP